MHARRGQIIKVAGVWRESRQKAPPREHNPDCDTIPKVMGAFGLRSRAEAAHS